MILLELNGEPIVGSIEFVVKMRQFTAGTTVRLKVFRAGREWEISVTLATPAE